MGDLVFFRAIGASRLSLCLPDVTGSILAFDLLMEKAGGHNLFPAPANAYSTVPDPDARFNRSAKIGNLYPRPSHRDSITPRSRSQAFGQPTDPRAGFTNRTHTRPSCGLQRVLGTATRHRRPYPPPSPLGTFSILSRWTTLPRLGTTFGKARPAGGWPGPPWEPESGWRPGPVAGSAGPG